MTRFQREVSGALGEFWKNNAIKEVEKAVRKADEDATVDADGAISWNCNGNYLMDDFCEKLEYAGYQFSRTATAEKRDEQTRRFIEEYKKNQAEPTEEELAEMRAAFGAGAKVVDVISGREIQL